MPVPRLTPLSRSSPQTGPVLLSLPRRVATQAGSTSLLPVPPGSSRVLALPGCSCCGETKGRVIACEGQELPLPHVSSGGLCYHFGRHRPRADPKWILEASRPRAALSQEGSEHGLWMQRHVCKLCPVAVISGNPCIVAGLPCGCSGVLGRLPRGAQQGRSSVWLIRRPPCTRHMRARASGTLSRTPGYQALVPRCHHRCM